MLQSLHLCQAAWLSFGTQCSRTLTVLFFSSGRRKLFLNMWPWNMTKVTEGGISISSTTMQSWYWWGAWCPRELNLWTHRTLKMVDPTRFIYIHFFPLHASNRTHRRLFLYTYFFVCMRAIKLTEDYYILTSPFFLHASNKTHRRLWYTHFFPACEL